MYHSFLRLSNVIYIQTTIIPSNCTTEALGAVIIVMLLFQQTCKVFLLPLSMIQHYLGLSSKTSSPLTSVTGP